MAVNLSPIGGVAGQFFDNNGDPLVGGKLYTYSAGTTTPQVTFTSASGVTPNSNPIILNGGGRVPAEIWLTDGLAYKFVLYSSTDQLIGSWDDIVGINSNFVNFTTSEEVQTATAGQTVFTLTTMQYQPGTNNLVVYVDGVNQVEGGTYSFVETNATTVTFTAGLHLGAIVKFVSAETLSTGITSAANVTFTGFKSQTGVVQNLSGDDGSDWIGFEPAGTGAVAMSIEDKLRETVSVKDFGAVGDGVADDTAAIQAAANYAASNYKELYFPDGVYKVTTKIFIDGAATGFRAVRWRGTFASTGTSAGYAPDLGQGGSTILTSGNGGVEIWFRRFFNENVSIRGLAFVDTASVYPSAITNAAAIKIIKGDPVGHPGEGRYITNNTFEDIATFGYKDAVLFRGSHRKDAGGSYLDNYIGPTNFIRFYPYEGGAGIVAENATLNRLRVSESLFFSLTSGGIAKREAADLPVGARTEMLIMCQLDMVHFEDVRGLFRIFGAPPPNEFINYVTMIDVTREFCGLFDAANGNPYGLLEHTNLIINGRHDQFGEVTTQALGVGSTVTSQLHQTVNVLIGPGISLSPDKINVVHEVFNLVSGGANLIKALRLAEGLGNNFDVTSKVIINGGELGIKTFHSYGKTQIGTGGRFHDEQGQFASGVTATVNTASDSDMQEFIVTNTSGSTVTVEIVVVQNITGVQLFLA